MRVMTMIEKINGSISRDNNNSIDDRWQMRILIMSVIMVIMGLLVAILPVIIVAIIMVARVKVELMR